MVEQGVSDMEDGEPPSTGNLGPTGFDPARICAALARVQEGGRRLPWELWTSCSFRRIKTAPLRDITDHGGADVLSGHRCHDGVVDLSMPEDQLFALVELVNAVPALLATIDEARWTFAQIAQMHSVDHGDIAERCMELGKKGYALLARDRDTRRMAETA